MHVLTTRLILLVLQVLFANFELVLHDENGELILEFRPRPKAVRIKFVNSSHKEISMLKMSAVQKSTVSIKPVDIKGNPAAVDGVPVWGVSADGTVSLFPSDDGLSCDVVGVAPGTVQVNVSADADLGTGVKTITGTLDVEVIAAEAVGFAITTGPVEDQ